MNNFFNIFKFTLLNEIKSKSYIITSIILVIIILLGFGIPNLIEIFDEGRQYHILVIDETDYMTNEIENIVNNNFENYHLQDKDRNYFNNARDDLEDGKITAILHVKNVENSVAQVELISENKIDSRIILIIESTINNNYKYHKAKELGISDDEINLINEEINLSIMKLNEDKDDRLAFAYITGLILLISVLSYGITIIECVSLEKTSRIKEILLTTVNPKSLLMGKIAGIGLAGLIQLLITSLLGVIFFKILQPTSIGIQGLSLNFHVLKIEHILFLILFFIFGYFLYSTLFAGFGALPSKVEDLPTITAPVAVVLLLAFYISVQAVENPTSNIAIFTSIFPYSAPFSMLMRMMVVEVPIFQIILSIVILVITIIVNSFISAKVYKVGALFYGNKLKLKELFLLLVQDK